jgi:excinuclease ABC subunit A
LGCLIAVTGVSGSGKSSLVNEVLCNTLARRLHRARTAGAAHDDILGLEHIDKLIQVDQEPLGNSPSSNPATYTGVFDLIRELFARLPESKVRGWKPQRFSFNKPGGRCEACEGNGQKKIEMHFLPDVWIECEVCHGTRFNPETLLVHYRGKTISDVLKMRVEEALELFANIPKVRHVLQTLADVGLGYMALGQPAPTLSGGEAQRVKLAAELARPSTGRTLYVLDEPTTGLHFDDIAKLLDVLNRLVDLGNTVVVVEHNLDVIKSADWVIDLGPEAGDAGGSIVAEGTPEEIVAVTASHTGRSLKPVLEAGPHQPRIKFDPKAVLAKREGDLDIDQVGRDARMPWEIDGQRWHTSERVSHTGKPVHWEGDILDWIDQQVHELGPFSDTNWNHRSVVEIAAATKSHGWFVHMMTAQERTVRLVFRVAKNSFKKDTLLRRLGIRPLNELEGLQVYGHTERVEVANRKGPWQEVTIQAFRLSEIDTPAFRDFLKEAVMAFQKNLTKMQTKPEDVMPWKVNGERWHHSDKGFPPGRKIRWERPLLARLLALVREVEPGVQVEWDNRAHILLRVPGVSRAWATFKTKQTEGLTCSFFGKRGQFNLARVDSLGATAALDPANGADVLELTFTLDERVQATKLKEVLTEHLRGFREVTSKVAS